MKVAKLLATGLLSVALVALPSLARPLKAETCYAYCPSCAEHLGGSDRAGPYPSKELCKSYVSKMRRQGFPYGDCQCNGVAPQGEVKESSAEDKQANRRAMAAHPVRMGVLGALTLAPVGWAMSGATSNDSKTGAEGAAAGAAAGFVMGFTLSKIAAVETKFAPLLVKLSSRVALVPLRYSPLEGRQTHGYLIRVRWTAP